ncbi:hypothetical protein TBK1r_50620 [Stieleria magnilauensis]|uniref:Uncharacterized protein n=1 Tax=Stieleria magnilauensis TaxID=2527963 RepID=A0ABX5XX70_9BACT|nr:hypothetical protein TBK1r_50620 [Planctomycetes bacterium TBK1r]
MHRPEVTFGDTLARRVIETFTSLSSSLGSDCQQSQTNVPSLQSSDTFRFGTLLLMSFPNTDFRLPLPLDSHRATEPGGEPKPPTTCFL